MCIDIIDGVDTPEGTLKRGKCGHMCAQCLLQRANVYGAKLPFVPHTCCRSDTDMNVYPDARPCRMLWAGKWFAKACAVSDDVTFSPRLPP